MTLFGCRQGEHLSGLPLLDSVHARGPEGGEQCHLTLIKVWMSTGWDGSGGSGIRSMVT